MPRPRNDFPKDLFYFWRYDPGAGALAPSQWQLKFEAHITSLSDSSSPSISEHFDMGRADPKVFYSGANRTVNISFFVVGATQQEHRDNHEVLLARLGRMTYPIYESGNGYNSPHVRFKIGGIIESYGIITNLTYDWKPEYPWIRAGGDQGPRPLYTDVSMTIKVLANSLGDRPDAGKRYFI